MIQITTRQYGELRDELATNLALDFFDDNEVEYLLREIESYDPQVRQKVLALALALSHASSSLVPGLLRHIKTASEFLSLNDLDRWVSNAFDLRDSQGIDQALGFLSSDGFQDLKAFQKKEGLPLREAAPLLETYLRAMSGRELKIVPDQETYTDTGSIYLPAAFNRFRDREKNFVLYKLAAAHAWAQVALDTLTPDVDRRIITARFSNYPPGGFDIENFFNLFPERQLSLDLYTIIEAFRAEYFLMKELPGLMKQASAIKNAFYHERQQISVLSEKTAFVEGLWQYFLGGKIKGAQATRLSRAVASLFSIQYEAGPKESVKLLFDLYDTAVALPGRYTPRPLPLFIARIRPEKISARLQELRVIHRKKLESIIAKLIEMPDFFPQEHRAEKEHSPGFPFEPSKEYLLIKGRLMELDEELKSLIEEKGSIPGGILVKGSEMGGGSGFPLIEAGDEEEAAAGTAEGSLKYDEWDYKRGGYKKHWCTLYEHDINPRHEPFVELTLKRYGGYVTMLRKKFEILKRERRVQRRQKDGDNIDFDAVVESFSDIRAGVSPSENLFTRIDRQERNIAVLFLVDMSGSTRGWVNEAEKESLVLMCEALETLGDRYAIYGFSGMTRNRCHLYRVKRFDEHYGESVKGRIAGIVPRDYTRMGPFIRHAGMLLRNVEARTKLLITLSDSRPEDWDGYKGDYGIEDTRKALIETISQGIHAFCITIDREAQSYLPHLFGQGNYILIDDVRKLPSRITEIYRRLTT